MATSVKVTCVVILLIGSACAQLSEGDSCKGNDGSPGVCKNIENCQAAKDELAIGSVPKICGFQGRLPVVCCRAPTKPTVSPPVNPNSKSKQKCKEYSKYVRAETGVVPLLPVYEPPTGDKTDKSRCVHGKTLILGGVPAEPKEFPHMANIGFGEKGSIKWACGGSLISEKFVLTAAHCLSSRDWGLARWIRLGDLNIMRTDDATETQDFEIAKLHRHPEYSAPAHYNDIALIEINRNAEFNGYVRPACIHTEYSIANDKLVACGWGLTDWVGSKGSDELLKVGLDSQDPTICNETFAPMIGGRKLRVGITPESMLCVGDLNGGKDTCKGDSGGPLQVRLDDPDCMYDIVGITSFGSICGAKNSPAVYTRVSHYIPWIESIVWP